MANGKPMTITPHALRKVHAMWLAMSGVPQRVFQVRLEHAAGSSITERFSVHATDEAQQLAVFSLPD